jgi:hypothetical protein
MSRIAVELHSFPSVTNMNEIFSFESYLQYLIGIIKQCANDFAHLGCLYVVYLTTLLAPQTTYYIVE